jgi:hypothetical protein
MITKWKYLGLNTKLEVICLCDLFRSPKSKMGRHGGITTSILFTRGRQYGYPLWHHSLYEYSIDHHFNTVHLSGKVTKRYQLFAVMDTKLF